jgi:ABC-type antimicrobial peptide transport system permease subunit
VLGVVGVVIGTAAAFGASRLLTALLHGVEPTDPMTFIAVISLLLAIAALATYLPARRAAALNPNIALRHE